MLISKSPVLSIPAIFMSSLFQFDEMQSQIAERDLQIKELKSDISSLEQELRDEEENKKIIADLRATVQTISSERDVKLNVWLKSSFMKSVLTLI